MSGKNDKLIHRWFSEVWNKGNGDAIDEMMHPKTTAHGLGAQPMVGNEAFKSFYQSFRDTFSNIHVVVDKTFNDGNYNIAMCTVTAIDKKSGNPVQFTGTSITHIKKGKIVEGWNYYDFLTMNLQIGKISAEQLT